jgi:hypothetical protein
MTHYQYQNLDPSKNEINILLFLIPTHEQPGLDRCTLHHVSLDEIIPEYRDFLSEMGPEISSNGIRSE